MRTFKTLVVASLLTLSAVAQGPDVIVGSLNGMNSYGQSGGIYAYSIGTTSCNVGSLWLNWFANTNQHPAIAQNIYRLKNGRFEQIGMSWLKHGFFALSQGLCFSDCQSTNGEHLGVHCSDPYDPGLNGGSSGDPLGPRNEVNASTGAFPYPFGGGYPPQNGTIARRIQCAGNDVNPTMNAGAVYFAEGHYVSPDDAAAGNKNNNASYRNVTFANNGTFQASLSGGTQQQLPAIMAWQVNDPAVVITNVDVPNDGRFIIARKVTSLGGGNFHYEFAVLNLNSDRSGRGFTVDFPAGTAITAAGFKDINHHSGEPYSGTDWSNSINGSSINWATQTYLQDPNANALRWGTLYNFWFNATAATETNKTIELFKTGPCAPEPALGTTAYALNTAAPYDNPTLTAPLSGPTGDDASLPVAIGFPFEFYGATYTSAYISTNGFLTFSFFGSTEPNNSCIPTGALPSGLIAGFWDDLDVGPGECQHQTLGSAPNRRFVVSWTNVSVAGTGDNQTFKIILDETTNKITSTIVSSVGGGSGCTRGVEDPTGTVGTQGSCSQANSAIAGTSWTYTKYTTISPTAGLTITGSTNPGGALTWSVNSTGAGAPVIIVASFDPGPTDMGAFGMLNIGFTPGAWVVIADGSGVLQPADPADFTDACGDYALTIPLPSGVPPSLTIYNQGAVVAPLTVPPPPNGAFHILQLAIIST